jgi:hypothetical protein
MKLLLLFAKRITKYALIVLLSLSITDIDTTCAQDIKSNLEKYFSALAKNQEFNGNVLIAENGKL